jgi:autotransporter-associated beta strand protein
VLLTNTTGVLGGPITIPGGRLESAAALSGTGVISIGSTTTTGTFRYLGSVSSTSNRVISMAGSTGGAVIDASGAGALVFTSGTSVATVAGNKTLTLTGSSMAANSIGMITQQLSSTTSLVKTGPGLWTLTGASTYSGTTAILDGTIVVGVNTLPSSGAFGTLSAAPTLGDASNGVSGTAAMLLAQNVTFTKWLMVPTSGTDSTQRVVIGGANTSGTAAFSDANSFIFAGRDLTLQAATSGTVEFRNKWNNATGDYYPTVNMTVGSAGNLGTVLLTNDLSTTGTVAVNFGRLHVAGALGQFQFADRVVVDGSGAELKYNADTPMSRPLSLVQGILSGTGTISADGGVTVGTSAILSPGNSPGIQPFTTGLTWASGGTYLWEVNNWATPVTAGTDYDQIQVSGGPLDITATSGSTFRIAITGLTASNTAGLVPNFDPYSARTFTIATSALGLTGFDATKFTLDTTDFSNSLAYGGFWISTDSGSSDVYLNYTPFATYTLAASAGSNTMIVGGTTTIFGVVTNTGTAGADTIDYSGFAAASLSGTLPLSPSSGLALANQSSGTSVADFTTATAGSYTFTPEGTFLNTSFGTPATATGTTTTTVTVLQHSNAAFALVGGGTQTIITGGTFSPVVFNLTNAGADRSPLDVANLVSLSGSVGSAVVASGGTASYAGTGLDSVTVGIGTLSVSLDAGDDQSLPGASALQTYTGSTTYTVLDHSYASFVSGTDSGVITIDFGEYDPASQSWLSGTSTSGYALWNFATNGNDALTAGLALTGTSVSGDAAGFELGISELFANLQSGSSNGYNALFNPSLSALVTGTQSATFTLAFADQSGLSGGSAGRSLQINMNVIIVPEPTTMAMGAIGAAMAGFGYWRRRRAV